MTHPITSVKSHYRPLRPIEKAARKPKAIRPKTKPSRSSWSNWSDESRWTVSDAPDFVANPLPPESNPIEFQDVEEPRPTAPPEVEHTAQDEAFDAGFLAGLDGQDGWLAGPGVTPETRQAFINGRLAGRLARRARSNHLTDADVYPAGCVS